MPLTQEQHEVIAALEESRAEMRKVGIPPHMDEGYARHLIEETVDLINVLIQITFASPPSPQFKEGVARTRMRVDAFRSMFAEYEPERLRDDD